MVASAHIADCPTSIMKSLQREEVYISLFNPLVISILCILKLLLNIREVISASIDQYYSILQ